MGMPSPRRAVFGASMTSTAANAMSTPVKPPSIMIPTGRAQHPASVNVGLPGNTPKE